jgi:pimeloyl-ACP methyl ester carboxylesterase
MKYLSALFAALTLFAAPSLAAPAPAAAVWETLPAAAALPPAQASGQVDHDGAKIWYATFGAGSPVILLHGGLGNSENWGDQVPALVADKHEAIVIDSRGQGRSTNDGRPLSYGLMMADVLAVMDKLEIQKAAVVGWSDGAITGLVMAMKVPQRVTRVFAFGANMDLAGAKPSPTSIPGDLFYTRSQKDYARLSPTPKGFDDLTRAAVRMWSSQPNYTAADLAGIHGPAVAIADGDHDEFVKREHTQYLAATIPGARLIVLPGVSHFAMVQKPDEFNAAMLGFLDGG